MTQPLMRAVRSLREAGDLRWRRPPPLRVGPPTGAPTVYYLAPHLNEPSGGVRNIYRHVDTLNANGITSAVLHAKPGFRCDWFANRTRIVYPSDVTLSREDVLVVAECYGPGLALLPDGPRILVFNQGAYHTFDLIPYDKTGRGAPYTDVANLTGLLAVSKDNVALLRYAFPALPVHYARLVIDADLFYPSTDPPARRIAYVTHRRPDEREHLLHVLRARGVLSGWELAPIEGCAEDKVAEIMRGSAIFLSFSERDGFGLPPAEAMASGCFVVGYTGMGGRDFLDPAFAAPVPDGDLLAFAQAVEAAVTTYEESPFALAKLGLAASTHIRAQYTRDGLRDDLLHVYGELVRAAA